MINTVSLVFELMIEALHKHSIVLMHKIDAVSEHLISSFSIAWHTVNDGASLSTALVSNKLNKELAPNSLNVQVLGTMIKA